MESSQLCPLDDASLIGLLLTSTIAFDCSGAQFLSDDDEGARELLEIVADRGSHIFFPDKAAEEISSLIGSKIGNRKKELRQHAVGLRKMLRTLESYQLGPDKFAEFETLINSGIEGKLVQVSTFGPQDVSEAADRLLELVNMHRGPEYGPDRLRTVYIDARSRYAEEIPPGFCDDRRWHARNPGQVHPGNAKAEPDCFADYVIWRQLLDHATVTNRPVLLIINDMKSDWWDIASDGTPIAPRSELRQEMKALTGQTFYALTYEKFKELAKNTFLPAFRFGRVPQISTSAFAEILARKTFTDIASRSPTMIHDFWRAEADLRSRLASLGNIDRNAFIVAQQIRDSMRLNTLSNVAPFNSASSFLAAAELKKIRESTLFARLKNIIPSGTNDLSRMAATLESISKNRATLLAANQLDNMNLSKVTLQAQALQDQISRAAEHEGALSRFALGKDATAPNGTFTSHPVVQYYIKDLGYGEWPVREVAKIIREDRLAGRLANPASGRISSEEVPEDEDTVEDD